MPMAHALPTSLAVGSRSRNLPLGRFCHYPPVIPVMCVTPRSGARVNTGTWYWRSDLQLQGKVLLLVPDDLHHWQLCGRNRRPVLMVWGTLATCGSARICSNPEGQDILICCPQGLGSRRTLSQHPSGRLFYRATRDYDHADFQHGEFHELDLGFEFMRRKPPAPRMVVACCLAGWGSRIRRSSCNRRYSRAGSTP